MTHSQWCSNLSVEIKSIVWRFRLDLCRHNYQWLNLFDTSWAKLDNTYLINWIYSFGKDGLFMKHFLSLFVAASTTSWTMAYFHTFLWSDLCDLAFNNRLILIFGRHTDTTTEKRVQYATCCGQTENIPLQRRIMCKLHFFPAPNVNCQFCELGCSWLHARFHRHHLWQLFYACAH